jgi:hypothetical protein
MLETLADDMLKQGAHRKFAGLFCNRKEAPNAFRDIFIDFLWMLENRSRDNGHCFASAASELSLSTLRKKIRVL